MTDPISAARALLSEGVPAGRLRDVLRAWDAELAGIAAERDRLAKRAAQIDARATRLADYLRRCMVDAGTRKLSTALVTCSVQAGSERVEIDCEPAALPPEYQRHKIEADKAALRDAHKAGKPLPAGVRVVRGEDSIRFR